MSLVQAIVPDDVLMKNFGKSEMSKWVVNPGLGFRSGRPKKTCQLWRGLKKRQKRPITYHGMVTPCSLCLVRVPYQPITMSNALYLTIFQPVRWGYSRTLTSRVAEIMFNRHILVTILWVYMIISTRRLCHIMWSRKWHNLPPPTIMLMSGGGGERGERPIFSEPSRIWSTYLLAGPVDRVVGTYWKSIWEGSKDRRRTLFPLKRKMCQIRSDWQLSGSLQK
jgi:hypothetical protein